MLRTQQLISTALSEQYAEDVHVDRGDDLVAVTVRAPLPLIGLLGFPGGVEVTSHAPVE